MRRVDRRVGSSSRHFISDIASVTVFVAACGVGISSDERAQSTHDATSDASGKVCCVVS